MLDEKVKKDMIKHANGQTSVDFERLINRLQMYTEQTEIKTSKDLVNLFLIVSVGMDVSEELFDKTVNRLHHVMVKKITGLDPQDIINSIEGKDKPQGPVQ